MSIQKTLSQIGLNEKEIEVYLALLKKGKASPSTLSKITKIKRATVYSVADSLVARGIVALDQVGKTMTLIPLPPESLKQIIERPMRELEEKTEFINKAIEELSLIKSANEYPVPRMMFVEERNIKDFLYGNIEKWVKSIKEADNVWWGTQDATFLEYYGDFNDWYWKQSDLRKGIKMRLIGNETEEETRARKKLVHAEREMRFATDLDFTSSVWVGGDYLIMIVTRVSPHYLFEMHDKTLVHNMREVFKKMWGETR